MVWLLVISSIVILLGFSIFVKRVFFYNYLSQVVLADNFVVTPEWKNIGNSDLLRIEKENNYISVLLEPQFQVDIKERGIRTPEDSIINPEIKLVDNEGNEYQLVFGGGRSFENQNFINYNFGVPLPVVKSYSNVLIRSNNQIRVKQILWTGYDSKDLP